MDTEVDSHNPSEHDNSVTRGTDAATLALISKLKQEENTYHTEANADSTIPPPVPSKRMNLMTDTDDRFVQPAMATMAMGLGLGLGLNEIEDLREDQRMMNEAIAQR